MSRSVRFLLLALSLVIAASAMAASDPQTLPQLFQQAKEQVAKGDWSRALKTLDRLEEASRQPGFEKDRVQLEPVIAFYRGVALVSSGKIDEGKAQFRAYLAKNPTARVTEASYPAKVVKAFDEVRLEVTGRTEETAGRTIEEVYAAFRPTAKLAADATWGETPVRFLMTGEEKSAWSGATDDAARARFVDEFWARRDPTPGTPENEFRAETERRILFADAAFTTEERTGRLSDRATVFTFLGPPNHIGQTSLSSDQALDGARGVTQGSNLGRGHQSSGSGRTVRNELSQGTREAWYYKADRIPEGAPAQELRFDFITRSGYGTDVLERNSKILNAVDRAVANAAAKLGYAH